LLIENKQHNKNIGGLVEHHKGRHRLRPINEMSKDPL